jgi:ubiquinone biosynthesis protein Coq4
MSRHNQQRSVEESRSLLGGTHAMKSVKLSVDILEGLSTGVNMGVSAPNLIHKWLNESRQPPSFMQGGLG